MPNPEAESLLRERIDDLSMRLLMAEPDSIGPEEGLKAFQTALAELGRQAAEAGYGEAARVAQRLAGESRTPAQLQKGLARLQQAVAEGSAGGGNGPPPPVENANPFPLAQDPELVADFVLESREHLHSIEQRLLTLERQPGDADSINSVFRGFHTIKGLAGFLGFAPIEEVAHDVETALNLVREGRLSVTPAVADVILASVDYLHQGIRAVESGQPCTPLPGHDLLLEKVRRLMAAAPETAAPEGSAPPPSEAPDLPAAPDAAPPPVAELPRQAAGSPRPAAAAESFSVRVDTAKLDYLVDMVGEMVIAQSLVRHNQTLASAGDPRLHRDLAQLSRITSEVQRTAMALRMVPIGQLFQRTGRQVRDLSRKIGKPVELVTRGEDTELDKTIVEALSDPLMHMVRNSIDHGIETPEMRRAAGKDPRARITLGACHQGGQVVIEVADDGRGLDVQKILARARQNGLIDESAQLSESETFRLIMAPGFSTAEQVTAISGRGVGMDVVRGQVEKLRGRIEIRSQAGLGASFLLRLPLTLAIIDGLVVTIGRHRYIVPMFAVREMFRPSAQSIFTVQNRQEMAMVRGQLLPVLRLYRRFGLVPRTEDPCQALLIVADNGGAPFCLMVDDLVGKQEVVIKSLGEGLGRLPGVAGGAILGDGRVGLILDVGGLWGTDARS